MGALRGTLRDGASGSLTTLSCLCQCLTVLLRHLSAHRYTLQNHLDVSDNLGCPQSAHLISPGPLISIGSIFMTCGDDWYFPNTSLTFAKRRRVSRREK